jgi:hypothetical protein
MANSSNNTAASSTHQLRTTRQVANARTPPPMLNEAIMAATTDAMSHTLF